MGVVRFEHLGNENTGLQEVLVQYEYRVVMYYSTLALSFRGRLSSFLMQ